MWSFPLCKAAEELLSWDRDKVSRAGGHQQGGRGTKWWNIILLKGYRPVLGGHHGTCSASLATCKVETWGQQPLHGPSLSSLVLLPPTLSLLVFGQGRGKEAIFSWLNIVLLLLWVYGNPCPFQKPYYWLSICSAWGTFTWTLSPQVLVSLLWNELVRCAGKTMIAKEGWWFLSSGMSLISVQFKHSESLLIWLFQRVNWNHFYLTPLKEDSLDFKCSVRGKEERLLQSDITIRPQLNIWVYQ